MLWLAGAIAAALAACFYYVNSGRMATGAGTGAATGDAEEGDAAAEAARARLMHSSAMVFVLSFAVLAAAGFFTSPAAVGARAGGGRVMFGAIGSGGAIGGGGSCTIGSGGSGGTIGSGGQWPSAAQQADMMRYVLKSPAPF